MINYISQQSATIETLRQDNEARKAKEASQNKDEANTPILGSRLLLTQGPMANNNNNNNGPMVSNYGGMANGLTPQPTGTGINYGGYR